MLEPGSLRDSLATLVLSQREHRPLGLLVRAMRALLRRDALVVCSSLAHNPADHFLHQHCTERFMRYLPELDPRVSYLGRLEWRADATLATAVLLSDEDTDATHPAWPATRALGDPVSQAAHKRRRVDSLFGGTVSPQQRVHGLMVAEPLDRVLQVLAGSRAVLQSDRPLVLMPLAPGPALRGIQTLLHEADYVLLDQNLWASSALAFGAAEIARAGHWVLAVPRQHGLQAAAEALWAAPVPGLDDASAWNDHLAAALMAEARAGGVGFGVYASSGSVTIALDNELAHWGFYPPEGTPGDGWAWIGPRPWAGMILPELDRPLTSVRLIAVATASPRNTTGVVARLDGAPCQVQSDWSQGYGIIDIRPLRPPAGLAMHTLELSCPEAVRPNDSDPRQLALSLASAIVFTARG